MFNDIIFRKFLTTCSNRPWKGKETRREGSSMERSARNRYGCDRWESLGHVQKDWWAQRIAHFPFRWLRRWAHKIKTIGQIFLDSRGTWTFPSSVGPADSPNAVISARHISWPRRTVEGPFYQAINKITPWTGPRSCHVTYGLPRSYRVAATVLIFDRSFLNSAHRYTAIDELSYASAGDTRTPPSICMLLFHASSFFCLVSSLHHHHHHHHISKNSIHLHSSEFGSVTDITLRPKVNFIHWHDYLHLPISCSLFFFSSFPTGSSSVRVNVQWI